MATADYIVTGSGNFQTNGTSSDLRSYTVGSVVTIDTGLPTKKYQVIFSGAPNLQSIGMDLAGFNALFPSLAPGSNPQAIPARVILFWSNNYIIVSAFDTNGAAMNAPGGGATVQIAVFRDGTQPVSDTVSEIDVNISGTPVNALTTPATGNRSLGNITPTDGVVQPFVGSGVVEGPNQGNVNVASQTFGTGLPINVFQ